MTGLALLLFLQPILPELPPPPELRPPSERPAVVPLEYDTLGVSLHLGSAFGFRLLARNDGPLLAERGSLTLTERNDHFRGLERSVYLDVAGTFKALQNSASLELNSFDVSNSRAYANLSLASLWHNSNLLVASRLQGYASTMSGEERKGAELSAKLFWTAPRIRILSGNRASLDSPNFSFISDLIMQSQFGFLLITPSVEAAVLPKETSILRPGAGLDLIAVLGNFTFDLAGYYHRTSRYIPDTVLLAPVQALLAPGITSYIFSDRIQTRIGYRGVDFTVFVERGRQPFWGQDSQSTLPELAMQEFSRSGGEVYITLEHDNFSNIGSIEFFLPELNTSWTPLWQLEDSLGVRWTNWGGFIDISAAGERRSGNFSEQPYVLLGGGVFYEKEPFRLVLRLDDLFDRRPLLWPGVHGPGRRVSLALCLFSTKW